METRLKILKEALNLFSDRGYDAAGVQKISEAAGITKPTLYYHFGSKKGLLNALLEQHYGELLANLREIALLPKDLSPMLEDMAEAYFECSRKNPVFFRMQLSMWFAPGNSDAHRAVSEYNARQQELMEALFMRAAERRPELIRRHRILAATYLGMVNTYIGLSLNGHVDLNRQIAVQAVRQFVRGIGA